MCLCILRLVRSDSSLENTTLVFIIHDSRPKNSYAYPTYHFTKGRGSGVFGEYQVIFLRENYIFAVVVASNNGRGCAKFIYAYFSPQLSYGSRPNREFRVEPLLQIKILYICSNLIPPLLCTMIFSFRINPTAHDYSRQIAIGHSVNLLAKHSNIVAT